MTAQQSKADNLMPHLIGLCGAMSGTRFNLIAPRTIIGRDPELCQMVLDNQVVSRRHAAIEFDNQHNATLTDLGSTHGTFINGERISQRLLQEGDTMGLGPQGVIAFVYRLRAAADKGQATHRAASPAPDVSLIRERLAASARLATTESLSASPAS